MLAVRERMGTMVRSALTTAVCLPHVKVEIGFVLQKTHPGSGIRGSRDHGEKICTRARPRCAHRRGAKKGPQSFREGAFEP